MKAALLTLLIMTVTAGAQIYIDPDELAEAQKPVNVTGKKVLMLIPSENFRDEEFEIPYDTLKTNGATITVACSKKELSKGIKGKEVTPDILHKDVDPTAFDCVIFVGGPGAEEYLKDPIALNLALKAQRAGKIVAAIGVAPAILANAGILRGKKATCFSSVTPALTKAGVKLEQGKAVKDGKIITSPGPEASKEFTDAIAAALVK